MLVRLHTRLNMLAAKDSKPVTSGERETTTTENEKSSATSMPQPSGLGELAAIATAGREGQSSSPSAGQQKTSGQTSNYKPRFHKTTAFAAKVEESEAQVDQRQEAQPTEEGNPSEAESSLDDDDGLYIPSYLEEVAPNDPVLQVRLARAM